MHPEVEQGVNGSGKLFLAEYVEDWPSFSSQQ
jgi:hypothetical protein